MELKDGNKQVLTSSVVGEEDETLCYQLDCLYRAFQFYYGSFENIFQVSSSFHQSTLPQTKESLAFSC